MFRHEGLSLSSSGRSADQTLCLPRHVYDGQRSTHHFKLLLKLCFVFIQLPLSGYFSQDEQPEARKRLLVRLE